MIEFSVFQGEMRLATYFEFIESYNYHTCLVLLNKHHRPSSLIKPRISLDLIDMIIFNERSNLNKSQLKNELHFNISYALATTFNFNALLQHSSIVQMNFDELLSDDVPTKDFEPSDSQMVK